MRSELLAPLAGIFGQQGGERSRNAFDYCPCSNLAEHAADGISVLDVSINWIFPVTVVRMEVRSSHRTTYPAIHRNNLTRYVFAGRRCQQKCEALEVVFVAYAP